MTHDRWKFYNYFDPIPYIAPKVCCMNNGEREKGENSWWCWALEKPRHIFLLCLILHRRKTKGQLISKADWRAIDSPKKRTDKFVLFAFLLFRANKSNSSVCFLGESTACQSLFDFIWPLCSSKSTHFHYLISKVATKLVECGFTKAFALLWPTGCAGICCLLNHL